RKTYGHYADRTLCHAAHCSSIRLVLCPPGSKILSYRQDRKGPGRKFSRAQRRITGRVRALVKSRPFLSAVASPLRRNLGKDKTHTETKALAPCVSRGRLPSTKARTPGFNCTAK